MRTEFIAALTEKQTDFGTSLDDLQIERLADYFELVQQHNPLLHLVAPSSPEEFATRHILESMTLLAYFPKNARFADVGTGAGLPSIPCLIAREDLTALLIESKEKKTNYLNAAVIELGLASRVEIVNKQFEEVKLGQASHVTCRALDKFTDKLPRLLKWSGRRKLLLFGGPSLGDTLTRYGREYEKRLMPLSERRYLFIVGPPTA